MNKTRTIGQKWLVTELFLYFLALQKCAKAQSNPIILSKVIVLTDDRQTYIFVKNIFSHSGVWKIEIFEAITVDYSLKGWV